MPLRATLWGATGTFLHAHSGQTGKWADRSCDGFLSICEAMPRSICGLAPTRYAKFRYAHFARYVPFHGTLWTAHINKWYVRPKLFLLVKNTLALGFQSRRANAGVPPAPFCTPGPTCSLLKICPRTGFFAAIGLDRGFAVSKTTGGKR